MLKNLYFTMVTYLIVHSFISFERMLCDKKIVKFKERTKDES